MTTDPDYDEIERLIDPIQPGAAEDGKPPATPPVIHIAGLDIQIGGQLRQRCSWCGAVLIDVDLSTLAVAVPDDQAGRGSGYPTWPPGDLVAVDGAMRWTVTHNDGESLPEGACARLSHDITGHTAGGWQR